MKNTKKNHQNREIGPSNRRAFRALPIIAALAASGVIQPAFAVDRTWFGGTGDFGVVTNWTPNGVPGSGDKAIINAGTSTLSSNTGIAGLSFLGGSFRGAGDLAVSGLTTFTGGQIGGDGGDVIANGGLTISGAADKTLGRVNGPVSSGIVNNGIATWSGAGNLDNHPSGRLTNSAGSSFDIQTDADFLRGTFINQGTLTKSVGATDGSDKTVISGTLNNTGSIDVQQGTLEVTSAFNNEGTINVASDAVFHGSNRIFTNAGMLQGDGTFQTLLSNALVNNGKIDPGNGIGHLTIDGDLNQTGSGAINFQLASLSSFDQLTVTDNVMLGGEIAVWNLGYTPVIGDSFVVATFDDRLDSSTFSSPVTTHGFGSGVNFNVIYHEHDVTLAVTAVPEPESWAMLLAGLGLVGAMARRRRI